MKIYQLKPTIVVQIRDKIFKIFDSADQCQEEFNRLTIFGSPLVDRTQSDIYEMSVVKILKRCDNILVMQKAFGTPLENSKNLSADIYLIGKYLANFLRKIKINAQVILDCLEISL